MAMSKALLEGTLTRYLTTGTPETRPTAWEISLHTGDPGDDGLDNEVSDTADVRQAVSMTVTGGAEPKASNAAIVAFPAAATGFAVTHVVIWGDGTMPLDIQQLRTSRVIAVGEPATFAVGEYTIGGV